MDNVYDVFGRRVEERVWTPGGGTQVRRFAWDGEDIWADLDGQGLLQTRYVRPDGLDALGARVGAGGVAWYLADWLGSVRALTDATGALRDRVSYDAFGRVESETDPAFGDRWKFTGREYLAGLGWQYNRERWYDPETGRWTGEDPLGFEAGDSNLARYNGNDPVNRLDPMGTEHFAVGDAGLKEVKDWLEKRKVAYRVEDLSGWIASGSHTSFPGKTLYLVLVRPGDLGKLPAKLPKGYEGLNRWNLHTVTGVADQERFYLSSSAAPEGAPWAELGLPGYHRLLARYNFELGYGPGEMAKAKKYLVDGNDPKGLETGAGTRKTGAGATTPIESLIASGKLIEAYKRFQTAVERYPGVSYGDTRAAFLNRYFLEPAKAQLDKLGAFVGLKPGQLREVLNLLTSAVGDGDYRPLVSYFADKVINEVVKDEDWRSVAQVLFRAALTDSWVSGEEWTGALVGLANKASPDIGRLAAAALSRDALEPEAAESVGKFLRDNYGGPKGADPKLLGEVVRLLKARRDGDRGERLLKVLERLDPKLKVLRSARDLAADPRKRDAVEVAEAAGKLAGDFAALLPAGEKFQPAKDTLLGLQKATPHIVAVVKMGKGVGAALELMNPAKLKKMKPDEARKKVEQGLNGLAAAAKGGNDAIEAAGGKRVGLLDELAKGLAGAAKYVGPPALLLAAAVLGDRGDEGDAAKPTVTVTPKRLGGFEAYRVEAGPGGSAGFIEAHWVPAQNQVFINNVRAASRRAGTGRAMYTALIRHLESEGKKVDRVAGSMQQDNWAAFARRRDIKDIPRVKILEPLGFRTHKWSVLDPKDPIEEGAILISSR